MILPLWWVVWGFFPLQYIFEAMVYRSSARQRLYARFRSIRNTCSLFLEMKTDTSQYVHTSQLSTTDQSTLPVKGVVVCSNGFVQVAEFTAPDLVLHSWRSHHAHWMPLCCLALKFTSPLVNESERRDTSEASKAQVYSALLASLHRTHHTFSWIADSPTIFYSSHLTTLSPTTRRYIQLSST